MTPLAVARMVAVPGAVALTVTACCSARSASLRFFSHAPHSSPFNSWCLRTRNDASQGLSDVSGRTEPVGGNVAANAEGYDRASVASDDAQPTETPDRRDGQTTCHVVHHHGSGEMHFSRETVEKLLASEQFFWLDLDQPDSADFEILSDVFKFHPLAIEDSEHFGQRAKIDDYDDFVFLVVYGAVADDDRLVEVHCFYTERFLVTVHRDDCTRLHRAARPLRET